MCICKLRSTAASIQNHRCWYCGFPMWEVNPAAFAKMHGLIARQAARF